MTAPRNWSRNTGPIARVVGESIASIASPNRWFGEMRYRICVQIAVSGVSSPSST